VAQDAACWKSRVLQAQQAAPQQAQQAQSWQPVPGRRVSLLELLVQKLWLVQVSRAKAQHAQVSQPRALQQVVLRESQLAQEPLASPPPVDASAQLEEQEALPEVSVAFLELLSPPLLSLNGRLPRRFPRPLRPSDGP
jgi:hypothetical protein